MMHSRSGRFVRSIRPLVVFSLFLPVMAAAAQVPQPAMEGAAMAPPPAFAAVKTPEAYLGDAWTNLAQAAMDAEHQEVRLQALAALSLLGDDPRAADMIRGALADPEPKVRVAAVAAAGESKSPVLLDALHASLADSDAAVAFGAARMLARAKDPAGENILLALSRGERPNGPGVVAETKRSIADQIRHPGALVKAGVKQGAEMMIGPLGKGEIAYDMIRKISADPMRLSAVQSLAEYQSDAVRDELVALLADKDPGVRATAARELAQYHQPQACVGLSHLLYDPKPLVKLTASAAYLAASVMPPPPPPMPVAETSAPRPEGKARTKKARQP